MLYYSENHYDCIKSLPAFFNSPYFCQKCYKPYSHFENHPCNDVCKKCLDKCCMFLNLQNCIKCHFCEVLCKSEDCLLKHRAKVCGKVKKCEHCKAFKVKNHVCNGRYCFYCKIEVDYDHRCFILTEEENLKKNNKKMKSTVGYIFFDYEAMQSDSNHKVNLVCATKKCLNCIDNINMCESNCGSFHWNTNEDFCTWLFSDINNKFIAIAHNMKSYDGYFIMNYIVSNK